MFQIISRQSRKPIVPGIDIFADGRCTVRTYGGEEVERFLLPQDVQALLEFFERQGLYSISNDSIKRAIEAQLATNHEIAPVIAVDGSETRIAARALNKQVEVSCYVLELHIENYPAVIELRTVKTCVERVYEIAGRID